MELRDLVRETRGLTPGTLARAGTAFLLEEGCLRHDTRRIDLAATRAVSPKEAALEEEKLTADLTRRKVYPLSSRAGKTREISIGRAKDCDVRLGLSSVSANHATVIPDGKGTYKIQDGGSKNGTFVEEKRLEPSSPVPLSPGSIVRFGPELKLTFMDGAAMENLLIQIDPELRKKAVAAAAGAVAPAGRNHFDPVDQMKQAMALRKPAYLDDEDAPAPDDTGPLAAVPVVLPTESPLSLACTSFPPVGLVSGVPVIVGRVAGNDLILPHPQVSRQHTRFERTGGEVAVTDLASSNGTWINERKITHEVVKPGATVGIGPYAIQLVPISAAPPRAATDGRTRVVNDRVTQKGPRRTTP